MGFGNLVNPNILAEKRLKRVQHDEKKEKKDKPEEKNTPTEAGKAATAAAGKTKAPLVRQHVLSSFKNTMLIINSELIKVN